MGRLSRWGVFFFLATTFALPARAADPILMFLLGFARNVIERQATEALKKPQQAAFEMPDLSKTYPGTTVEPAIMRRLIDDSFLYLSSEQRKEIFDSLNRALLDPKNAAIRSTIIEHFVHRSLAVRAAQIRLSQLSYREKELMADELRQTMKSVPPAELGELRKVIGDGLLPVPADMSQMFLAVLDEFPATAVAAPANAPAGETVPTTAAPEPARSRVPTSLAPLSAPSGG